METARVMQACLPRESESKHLSTIWFLPPVNSQARYMPEWLGSCQSGMVWASGRPNVKSKTDLSPDLGRLQAKGRFFCRLSVGGP